MRATFFVIGREAAIAPGALKAAAAAGHEIGSHSYGHDYALSRRTREEIAQDLGLAERAIEDACGQRPRGFRAPGYTLSARLLDAVRERGYAYDSSLLPSLPYYAAKAAALGYYTLRGRASQSILGGMRQLFVDLRLSALRTENARLRSRLIEAHIAAEKAGDTEQLDAIWAELRVSTERRLLSISLV